MRQDRKEEAKRKEEGRGQEIRRGEEGNYKGARKDRRRQGDEEKIKTD